MCHSRYTIELAFLQHSDWARCGFENNDLAGKIVWFFSRLFTLCFSFFDEYTFSQKDLQAKNAEKEVIRSCFRLFSFKLRN